ncbi:MULTISPECIES: peptide deformylase [unclassified Streptomyces]|uniref:peptide deformylase n=1 Tax=unclassified Streptomyces TaxID=2593676 RepID=UPI0037FF06E4
MQEVTTTELTDLVDAFLDGPRPLPIVQAGDPVLRRRSVGYEGQLGDARLARLIEAMRETMRAAPGVGLAAPQVGIPLRLAVLEDPAEVPEEVARARGRVPVAFRVLVNPSYEPVGEGRAAFFEGCLSVSGWQAVVARHARIRLRARDERGRELDEEFAGWPARIVQHETDHLDGTLYLDLAETRSLSAARHMAERWSQPSPVKAAEELGFPLPG